MDAQNDFDQYFDTPQQNYSQLKKSESPNNKENYICPACLANQNIYKYFYQDTTQTFSQCQDLSQDNQELNHSDRKEV